MRNHAQTMRNHAQTMCKPCTNNAQPCTNNAQPYATMRNHAQTCVILRKLLIICVVTEVYCLERLVGKAVKAPAAAGISLSLPVVVQSAAKLAEDRLDAISARACNEVRSCGIKRKFSLGRWGGGGPGCGAEAGRDEGRKRAGMRGGGVPG